MTVIPSVFATVDASALTLVRYAQIIRYDENAFSASMRRTIASGPAARSGRSSSVIWWRVIWDRRRR
jgi:hypothetical protein